jgi:hypothetical protein
LIWLLQQRPVHVYVCPAIQQLGVQWL